MFQPWSGCVVDPGIGLSQKLQILGYLKLLTHTWHWMHLTFCARTMFAHQPAFQHTSTHFPPSHVVKMLSGQSSSSFRIEGRDPQNRCLLRLQVSIASSTLGHFVGLLGHFFSLLQNQLQAWWWALSSLDCVQAGGKSSSWQIFFLKPLSASKTQENWGPQRSLLNSMGGLYSAAVLRFLCHSTHWRFGEASGHMNGQLDMLRKNHGVPHCCDCLQLFLAERPTTTMLASC